MPDKSVGPTDGNDMPDKSVGPTRGVRTPEAALLWPAFRLVIDIDDTREADYGRYYTQEKPLTLAALRELPGI